MRLERELLQWASVRAESDGIDAAIHLLQRFLRPCVRRMHQQRRLLRRRDLRHPGRKLRRCLRAVQPDHDDHDRRDNDFHRLGPDDGSNDGKRYDWGHHRRDDLDRHRDVCVVRSELHGHVGLLQQHSLLRRPLHRPVAGLPAMRGEKT
jgi:hypothetical protein